jgi:CheY-like chemotaxis protein
VNLRCDRNHLELQIRDNGRGISAAELLRQNGFGLTNMQNRARKIGGKLRHSHRGRRRHRHCRKATYQLHSASVKSMNTKIRILIGDDHPVVREGLVEMLTRQKDMSVIGEAKDGEEVCQLYDKLSPDILILDLRMPKKDGLQVIAELLSRAGGPKPRILVMTTYEGEEDIRRALNSGAKGYLLKGADLLEIREAVRKVSAGQSISCRGRRRQIRGVNGTLGTLRA